MDIGFEECARAMVDRDPAYDGKFFIAVLTTGVYCRPVCRVKTPKVENVRFYPTAAAAEAAGFRPCLRCRPESAPFSPAWNGSKTTVTRALRLISEGALDEHSLIHLADRLGVTDRHLRRLFSKHVGASPYQTARTLRLQKAKRMIDCSQASLTDIALESGFRSLSAFSKAFTELYGRRPSSLRKSRDSG